MHRVGADPEVLRHPDEGPTLFVVQYHLGRLAFAQPAGRVPYAAGLQVGRDSRPMDVKVAC
jgi:hypothetical protein